MLILDRRIGERLMIGDEVVVTVVGVNGCQVRLGIEAPRHVPVHREEIYARIQREKSHAAYEASASTPCDAAVIPVTYRGRGPRAPQR